jgi:hypothetical protein
MPGVTAFAWRPLPVREESPPVPGEETQEAAMGNPNH